MEDPEGASLGQWLRDRCRSDKLSLRQASAKTGLSHTTIQGLLNGSSPSPETVRKLALGFSGDHQKSALALEDRLLTMAGHRTVRKDEVTAEPLARLLDKIAGFNEAELGLLGHFADFVSKLEER